MENVFECFIEISKNSNIKYEYSNKKLKLDRILFSSSYYPQNYGFITETLGEDSDPLDVVIISLFPLLPGTYADARVLGSLEMIDSGEEDLKVISIMDKDPRLSNINSLNEIPEHWLSEIKQFFIDYKKLERKEVKIGGFLNLEQTLELIQKAKNKYKENSKRG